MKFYKLSSKFIINTTSILCAILVIPLLIALQNMASRKNELSRELSYLKVILDYCIVDLQIKEKIMGKSFRKSIVSDFVSKSNKDAKYYITIIEGIMTKNSDFIQIVRYLDLHYDENDVQIIASVAKTKKIFFKNKINNDNIYITASFHSHLIKTIDIGIYDITILLLDSNGICIYTFLFHYNCFTQVLENEKILSSIINRNSHKYEN